MGEGVGVLQVLSPGLRAALACAHLRRVALGGASVRGERARAGVPATATGARRARPLAGAADGEAARVRTRASSQALGGGFDTAVASGDEETHKNQPPRGNEPIVTLGGIDLNNSGSVVVKEDRKLLTVLFPDGRDGRTFTLKAETTEELNEWRSALESALAQAPSVANTVGQNPIFSTDVTEPSDAPTEQSEDKSSVIGRPAEFSLVDPDGSPSFLEKALRFIEDYGVKVEGILRQSADVEEVKRRFRDYEKGKNEFSAEDDGHVIGDCIKCILREMPGSPIPASCCTALVTAYRADKARRLDAINKVVYEVFPEPNRQLLQRTLKMMMVVGSHKAVNRMSNSALAACMAPLLLRPLLLGECEIDSDFSMAGDGSFQLLQAAAAANHAQAIIIIMLEEYDQIFDDLEEGSCSSDAYTDSDDGDVDKEYSTDNENHDEDGSYDSGEDDIEEDLDDNTEHSSGGSECDANSRIDAKRDKVGQPPSKAVRTEHGGEKESCESNANIAKSRSASSRAKLMKSSSSANRSKRTLWGRTSARKDLSTEEVECCSDDEALIEKLENNKADLQSKVSKEVKENANLQASLERRKESLHERRIALEKEVENLRDQLQKERSLRTSLESGLMNMRRGQVSFPSSIDSKTKADLEEVAAAEADILNLKQKACDLRGQLSSQVPLSSSSLCESCNKRLINSENLVEEKQNDTSTEASSIVGSGSVPRLVPGTGGMAELVEQLRRQAAQHSSSSTGAQRLARQNSNSPQLNRFQGPNAYSSIRTEEPPAALAKLTNRLNFLKERRALLASEMQNLDMARPPAAPPTAPAPNKDQ